MVVDTEHMWEMRIKRGYVQLCEDEHGEYYEPIWEHKFWRSGMGFSVAKQLEWTMPDHILEASKINRRKRRNKLNLDNMTQGQAMSAVVDFIHSAHQE